MTEPIKTGRLDYPREGFTVFWDEHGIRIEVIDYHAETLRLSWEMILALAQRAQAAASSLASHRDAEAS